MGQFHHIGFIQPAKHLSPHFRFLLSRLKTLLKGHVKFVEIRLALHQNHPGHMIKLRQGTAAKPLIQRFLQGKPLSQCHPKPFCPKTIKKIYEHPVSSRYNLFALPILSYSFMPYVIF